MKKYSFTAIIICLISLSANAQKVRIGMNAGVTMGNMTFKEDNEKETSKLNPGVTAGIAVDIPLGKNFSVQPGANYLMKGGREEYSDNGFTIKEKMNMSYLEFPVHLLYNTRGAKGNFFAGLGITGAFGISGKYKIEEDGEKETEKIYFGSEDDDDFKAAEIGGSVLTGYTFPSGLTLSAGYNIGLNNVSNYEDFTARTSYFMLRIGWMFK